MQEIIINIMNDFGYLGIAFLIAAENVFPPIPSEVILTFGGFMTTYSNLHVIGVVISSVVGSTVGAIVLYLVGRLLGKEKIERLAEGKVGKILRFKKKDIEKANEWFEKRGNLTVFFCRFIPIVRSLISIPAGMTKMKFVPFITLTTLGSAIWNVALVYLGVVTGSSWEKVVDYIDSYSKIVLILILIAIAIVIFAFYKKRIANVKRVNEEMNDFDIEE